jgi:hypothetical protein
MASAGQIIFGNGAKLKRANQSGTTEWITIKITAANCRVRDLEIDGNKTNYTTAGWATTSEIYCGSGGDHSVVEGCYIHDFPGEGIQHGDCNDFVVIRNWLQDGNGNGVHYGSSAGSFTGGRVLYNRIKNVNLNTAVGHADGCVVLSNGVADFLVHGNYLENGIAGVGSVDQTDNSDITITNNEIRSMTGAAIEGDNPTGTSSVNVLIQGNRIYDSVKLYINQQVSGSTAFPSRWSVIGNLFSNTKILGNYSRHCLIANNIFTGGSTTMNYIDMSATKYLTVIGNHFESGQYALTLGGAFEGLSFKDNTCFGQHNRAINIFGTGCITPNVIANNTIENDATADSAYDAISVASGQDKISIKNNEIKLVGGNSGMTLSANYAVVMGNTVRCGTAPKSIRIAPVGATSNWVGYNTTDVAVSDAGTTTTLVSNAAIT